LATVAALALVAGNSAVSAQDNKREGPEPRGTVAPTTPGQPAAPKQKAQAPSERPGPTRAQPTERGPAQQPSRAQQPAPSGPQKEQPATAQTPRGPSDQPTHAQPAGRERDRDRAQTPKQGEPPARATETRSGAPGDAKSVQLNTEQRSRIRSVIVSQRVEKTTRVNFNINIGVRVPRAQVHLYPVPVTVVEFVPAYSGYLYFYYEEDDVIVIVHPTTLEIVAVIPA